MFKSRSKERLIFSTRRRRRPPNFSWLWILVSLALLLFVTELLIRIAVDLTGRHEDFAQIKEPSNIIDAYQLRFISKDQKLAEVKNASGYLLAKPSISVGYELLGQQNHQYWHIDERGFRDRDPVPLDKPQGEVRIFLLGGSTAFGYGASSNQTTISEQLEARLQQRLQQQQTSPQLYQPNILPSDPQQQQKSLAKPSKIKPGNYRIINAAVPGYASGNELAQLALHILSYKPDLVIILDGYTDLMLPGNQKAVQFPQQAEYLIDRPRNFSGYVKQFGKYLETKSYLAQIVRDRFLAAPQSNAKTDFVLYEEISNLRKHLPQDEAELDRRVDRYWQHNLQILKLCAGAKVPLIVATQPEITGRNPSQLTSAEGEIATKLGRTYINEVKESYPRFVAANQRLANAFPYNVRAVNLYNLSEKYPSPSFIDPVHLNEAANQKVAEQLYYAIAAFPKMQVASIKPKIKPMPIKKIEDEE